MLVSCPYDGCTFQGSQQEVDDHVVYMDSYGLHEEEPEA